MARIYNFAIVRVSPDPRRGELVNIGIVVFLPRSLDVRVLPSLSKVHALHGELNLAELYGLPDRLASYAKIKRSVADRFALIRNVGIVELSDLGQFRAADDNEYSKIVDRLLTNLVRPTLAAPEGRETTNGLYAQVKRAIKDAKLLGRQLDDIEKHKIVAQFPLAPAKGLYADFAGRNSVVYVTETIDFRVNRGIQGPKFNESAKATLVLREAARQFATSKRFLLYAASAQTESRVQTHLTMLDEFATDFVNFESAQDRGRYVGVLAAAFGGELSLS
jgi:hypothetical protein